MIKGILVFFGVLVGNQIFAKGLDQLAPPSSATTPANTTTPTEPEPAEAEGAAIEKPPVSKPMGVPVTPPVTLPTPEVIAKEDSKEQVGGDDADQAPAEPRSATSLALADRLNIFTTIGFSKVTPKEGTWTSLGQTSLGIGWRFTEKETNNAHGTIRIVPLTGVWKVEDRYYDTAVQGVFFGGEWQPNPATAFWDYRIGGELGYQFVSVRPQDRADPEKKFNAGKFGFAITARGTRLIGEKISIGPALRLASGYFTTTSLELMLALSF